MWSFLSLLMWGAPCPLRDAPEELSLQVEEAVLRATQRPQRGETDRFERWLCQIHSEDEEID